ncbi:MAG: hypothetical protein CYPHOPRED_001873 [Cyphobasidiales sp. Tagirdzhanova-0007]|nr:MAG: hypothetical protein CYPHOPRED_001873 [Cyphobasidiales sp. Tagirdzhanova-0007]
MNSYEIHRATQIAANENLIRSLGLSRQVKPSSSVKRATMAERYVHLKRRRSLKRAVKSERRMATSRPEAHSSSSRNSSPKSTSISGGGDRNTPSSRWERISFAPDPRIVSVELSEASGPRLQLSRPTSPTVLDSRGRPIYPEEDEDDEDEWDEKHDMQENDCFQRPRTRSFEHLG